MKQVVQEPCEALELPLIDVWECVCLLKTLYATFLRLTQSKLTGISKCGLKYKGT